MHRLLSALCLAAAAGAAQGQSADPAAPVVVELYTSQGCATCPPADRLLSEIARRPDVIALALHVDYWDYLGWADSFASPAFTARQKAYARAAGSKSVYTPQMIVNGIEHLVGTRELELSELIRAHGTKPMRVRMTVRRQGEFIFIEATAAPPLENGAVVQVVGVLPEATVSIERGENAGHTRTYTNVVQSWDIVAEWDGMSALSVTAEAPQDDAVVILQEPGPGPILAAARVP